MWCTTREGLQLTHLCLLGIFPGEELIDYALCVLSEQASTGCPTEDNIESSGENRGGVESDRNEGHCWKRKTKAQS